MRQRINHCFVCLALLCLACGASRSDLTNILVNGGFEGDYAPVSGSATATITGNVAPGWHDNSNWAKTTIQYVVDSDNPHGGTASQKITLERTEGGWGGAGVVQFKQDFTPPAPGRYDAGVWMRSLSPMDVSFSITEANPPYNSFAYRVFHLDAQWQLCSLPVFAPIRPLAFQIRTTLPGTFWVDDAYLNETATTASLDNPGFDEQYYDVADSVVPQNMGGRRIAQQDTGNLATGWWDDSGGESGSWGGDPSIVKFEADPGGGRAGSGCQKVTLSQWDFCIKQSVLLKQGHTYTAGVWLRADPPVRVEITLSQGIRSGKTFASCVAEATTSWSHFSCTGSAPGDFANISMKASTPAVVWIGDASLDESLPQSEPRLWAVAGRRQPIAPTFFGTHLARLSSPWPSVPIGAIRIWDSGNTAWGLIERQRGVFNWDDLDKYVARAERHCADVLYTICLTPNWASAHPAEPGPYGPGFGAEPSSMDYWSEFLTALGARYKGKIRYYEIINEPGDANFFSGSPAKLAEMARIAYKILKTEDPSCIVTSPAIIGSHTRYWEDYLLAGGGDSADIISFHGYSDTPESSYADVAQVRSILKEFGLQSKPMIDSEVGWGDRDHWLNFTDSSEPPFVLGDSTPSDYRDPAAYLSRSYLLAAAEGLVSCYWYAWDNHDWCWLRTTEPDNATLTAAGKAYATVEYWLTGATVLSCDSSPSGVWIETLRTAHGLIAHVLWSPDASRTFILPSSWRAISIKSLTGEMSHVPADRAITVGPEPMLIRQS